MMSVGGSLSTSGTYVYGVWPIEFPTTVYVYSSGAPLSEPMNHAHYPRAASYSSREVPGASVRPRPGAGRPQPCGHARARGCCDRQSFCSKNGYCLLSV
jgi:hypothetical protein